ncbi:MAG: hypothetical protein AUJ20_10205 [Comamonadaceae bacterium CG1_02_60_18]|nr:MAG: hypothetical protein AUJ20_10205 [Comamonadaceae bacterium CG1_02_60_18]PIQ51829.1 MAG: hypothetical protein COW02_12170 [Comamonadaceae bacterium CG12_big_fil_rev_8_21_14_0_65_59_15]
MYIVPLGWLYVALMMAVAEATSSTGTVLGAVITFLFYGLLPVALVVYLMGAPSRARTIKAREQAEAFAAHSTTTSGQAPDAGGKAPGDPVAPMRKEP